MHDQTTLTINPNAKANDTVKVTRMRKQGSQSHAARGRNAWTTYCTTFKTHLDAFGTQTCHLFAPHSVMQLIFGIDIVCGYLISIVHGGTTVYQYMNLTPYTLSWNAGPKKVYRATAIRFCDFTVPLCNLFM